MKNIDEFCQKEGHILLSKKKNTHEKESQTHILLFLNFQTDSREYSNSRS